MKANLSQNRDLLRRGSMELANLLRSIRIGRRSADPGDYHDRISVGTWPVIMGLALSLFIELPTVEFSVNALGSPASIPMTGTVGVAFFLALVAASSAESVVSAHPRLDTRAERERGRTWPFWALPMALTIIATLALPRLPTPLMQVLALMLASGLFIGVYFALYYTVEPGLPGYRRARLLLNIATYAAAVLLFLFLYQTRTRSLVSATLVSVTGMLLAVELLRDSAVKTGVVIGYGAIVGLILGEATWALNYWPLPSLTGGLLLLLIFYITVSMAQSGLQGRMNARVIVEFLIVAAVAVILLALVGPGFTLASPADLP